MLRRLWLLGILVVLAAGLCAAEQQTLTGYLMDKACSADALKKGEEVAKKHGRDCALMEDCVKTGYGVITAEGKFITFDQAGNKRAIAALKVSKKENDLRVTVTGDVSGDSIKVASLKIL
ncbi:MAG: hypothetical protein HY236_11850 [Acidobacteria bacterium]|nr:hypothetical protein [Acidobacteriota bacterium]